VVIGYVAEEGDEPKLQKFMIDSDVREDVTIQTTLLKVVGRIEAKTVSLSDGVVGCPHEAGVDFPEGEVCPVCEYWQGR